MRFYLDENLPYRIADAARRLGLDVVSTRDYGRNGTTDVEQLRFAAGLGRCIITITRNDLHFRPRTLEFVARGEAHCGALVVPPSLPNHAVGEIARVIAAYQHLSGRMPAYLVDYLRPVRL